MNGGNGGGGSGGGAGGGGAGSGSGGGGGGSGGGGGGTSGRSSTAARDSRRQTRVIRTGRDRGSGLLGSQPQPVIPASVIPEELITQVRKNSKIVNLKKQNKTQTVLIKFLCKQFNTNTPIVCSFSVSPRPRSSSRGSPEASSFGNSRGPTWT